MLLCKNCGIENIYYLLVYCFNFISEPPKKIHISCPREVTRVGLFIISRDVYTSLLLEMVALK